MNPDRALRYGRHTRGSAGLAVGSAGAQPVPWRVRAVGAAAAVLLVGTGVVLLLAVAGHPVAGDVGFARSAHKAPPAPVGPGRPEASPAPRAGSSPGHRVPGQRLPGQRLPSKGPVRVPAARAPLTVLNNSTIVDLGDSAAARFRAAGWPIAVVDGLSGRYRYPTVYYGPGQLELARALVRQFPGIRVIDSRAHVPALPGTGLTVVVTKDFR